MPWSGLRWIPGAQAEGAGGQLILSSGYRELDYCALDFFFFVVLCFIVFDGAMPLPVPPAVGLLAAAPPATGGWPPVAGPFCAIASEVAPARRAAARVTVLKLGIIFSGQSLNLTHPLGTHANSSGYPKFPGEIAVKALALLRSFRTRTRFPLRRVGIA
jgi:hypothetical protein